MYMLTLKHIVFHMKKAVFLRESGRNLLFLNIRFFYLPNRENSAFDINEMFKLINNYPRKF